MAEIEAKTLKWAAENPEVRYPTWREWQREHFPDAAIMIRPCEFMSGCFYYRGAYCCSDCRNQTIPADIAEKLGIKPKEA